MSEIWDGSKTRAGEIMDQFYEKLEDMELDIQKGSMEFNKAIWTPYSIQIRLYSLQRIVIKTYGNKGSRKFNLSVIKLINLIYELMVKLDESVASKLLDLAIRGYNRDQ